MNHSFREAFNRMRSFFRKHPLDQELDEEIASHLEMAVEESISARCSCGRSPPPGPCTIWRSATSA
jgi:hypothetical protein